MSKELKEEINLYWTDRAEGYSKVNQEELAGNQQEDWSDVLLKEIKQKFPDRPLEEIRVLDIGTGPGFFAILMAKAGLKVTAIDGTEAMLLEAKKNAGELAGKITFRQMDAQHLDFPDESFDVILSRNLTWVLPEPERAYKSWKQVLCNQGVLINFDANWYSHLFDEEKRRQYELDRENVEKKGVEDHYTCTNIDAMEKIAREVPLSRVKRPEWDIKVLKDLGMSQIEADVNVWERVWSPVEKVNYASTPMFMIKAVKREWAS